MGPCRPRFGRALRAGVLATSTVAALATVALGPASTASAADFGVVPVSSSLTPTQLAQYLVGSGTSVVDGSVSLTGPDYAAGIFTNGATAVGLDNGVALTSGYLGAYDGGCTNSLIGPNAGESTSCSDGGTGDADLNALLPTGEQTTDVSALEFDVVPTSNQLAFTYVFGSEEYNEFVGSSFNDVFGLFINGVNCATVPGTDPPDPVSINTINLGKNDGFYVDNDIADSTATRNTELDGLTVPLSCSQSVTPNQPVHVKLAVGDVGDDAYDSVVMIGGGSLSSGQATSLTLGADPTQQQYSDTIGATAHLTGPDGPLSGKAVTLTLGTSHQTVTTDGNGDASATLQALATVGTRQIVASYGGEDGLLPAYATKTVDITPEDCQLLLTGDADVAYGNPTNVQAAFSEPSPDASAGDWSGHLVTFTATKDGSNPVTVSEPTAVGGQAAGQLPLTEGTWQVTAAFVGDDYYSPCSTDPISVVVEPPTPTSLAITTPGTAQYSDPLDVSAKLSVDGGLAGEPVDFTLGTSTASAITDDSGLASATLTALTPPGTPTLQATFAGGGGFGGSTDSVPVTITPEDCTLTYNGATVGVEGHTLGLAASMGENDETPGNHAGKAIVFTAVSGDTQKTFTATTGSAGIALANATLGVGTWQVTPSFVGDAYYSACSGDPATVTVDPIVIGGTATATKIVSVASSVQYSDHISVRVIVTTVAGGPIAAAADQSTGDATQASPAVAAVADLAIDGGKVVVSLGSSSAKATTDATGHATVTLKANDPAGNDKLDVTYVGAGEFASSTTSQSVKLLREDSRLAYIGKTSFNESDPASLVARLSEIDASIGNLSGRTIDFTLRRGSVVRHASASTGSGGHAVATPHLGAGTWSVTPHFAGDGWYLPALADTVQVVVHAASSGPVVTPTPTPTTGPTTGPTNTTGGGTGSGTGGTRVLGEKETRSPKPEPSGQAAGPLGGPLGTPAPADGPEAGGGSGGGESGNGGHGAEGGSQSELNTSQPKFVLSIPDVHQVTLGSSTVLLNGLIALLMILMIAFPAELFNGTLKENYDEVRGWFGPITRGLSRLESTRIHQSPITRIVGGVLFVALTGAVYASVEPGFGLHRSSLQLLLALTAGLAIITLLANESALLFGRLRYHERGRLRMRPGSLLVALGCVVLSRAANFEPGYVYGLVAGFTFSRELPRRQDGKVVLAWAGWLLTLALGGWLLLSPAKSWALHHEHSFWAPVVEELTAAVVVESLTILILALVPLSFLEGERLWKWRRTVWVVVYGIALFAFLHVVVHPEFGGRKTELPLFTWLGFFVGFGLLSVSFWGYFRFRKPRHMEPHSA